MASSSSSSLLLAPLQLRSHPSKDHNLILSLVSISIPSRSPRPLRASRKNPNHSKGAVVFVPDPRAWIRDFGAANYSGDLEDCGEEEEDEEEDDDDDRSLDLLARLFQNMFRKISRHARRAVRSVLPPSMSTKLVRFTVDGVLILAFLWILKAFLEVACRVGSIVFTSILLIRGIWSGMSFIKESKYNNTNRVNKFNSNNNNNNNTWGGVQPVA